MHRPSGVPEPAGDDPHTARTVRQVNCGNVGSGDRLISGGRHLVFGGKVDPELYHAKRTASLGEARRMKLLVEDAARRCHPLHATRADDAALAGRIPVRDLAVINDSDRFKPAMPPLAKSPTRFSIIHDLGNARYAPKGTWSVRIKVACRNC